MKYFITFGAGEQNYIDAGQRIITQAESCGIFDKIILYTDEYLKQDSEFWSMHSAFIESNPRGYGFWLWKPYIIKKTMEQLHDDDILVYADGGCEIDIKQSHLFNQLFDEMNSEHVLGTRISIEKYWNKMDLILHLDMKNDKYMNSRQNQATTNMYRVCDKVRDFVNQWYDLACNYHFIDNSPSIKKNADGFQEHRHDQSIFSLLTKKMDIYNYKPIDRVILIKRNRSGKSMLT